jgi:hypothetical protein
MPRARILHARLGGALSPLTFILSHPQGATEPEAKHFGSENISKESTTWNRVSLSF